MPVEIAHAPEMSEFVALDETGQVGVLQYVLSGDVIDIQHTVVQPHAGGRGIGSALVVAALDHARAEGLRVIPTCPFVPAVLARHPEYADLV
jgi:predicted GNAT family acetyltransferase